MHGLAQFRRRTYPTPFQTVLLRSEFVRKTKLCSSKPPNTLLTTGFNLYLCSGRIDTNLLASQPAAHKGLASRLGLVSLTGLSSHQTQHTQNLAVPHRVASFQAAPVCQRLMTPFSYQGTVLCCPSCFRVAQSSHKWIPKFSLCP